MTLAGRHLVVCRAATQSGPLVDAIEQQGAIAVHTPLIEVVPPVDGGDALRRALATVDENGWVVVTSANGADAVAASRPEVRWKLGVVGRATARRAEELGLDVTFESPEPSGEGLGRTLPVLDGERVVAAVAELASDDLADALERRGIEVEVVTAYRTRAPATSSSDLDRIRAADLVFVTSPSVIARLLDRLDPADLPALIAIGEPTAAAIRARGLAVAATAAEPSTDGLIAAALHTLGP